MSAAPPPERDRWALAATSAGLFASLSAANASLRTLPDTFEMLVVGRCMLGGGDCAGLDLLWWPPLYGLLAAGLEAALPTGAALALPSLLPMAAAVFALVLLAGRLGGRAGALAAGLALAVHPVLHAQAMTADARALALAGTAAAWCLATGRGRRATAAAAGALAGLAVLARPEALLAAALVPVVVAARQRSLAAGGLAGVGVLAAAGPWWAALSAAGGRLVLRPRGVEGWAVPLLDALPKDEVVRLIGASAGDTPFRAAARLAGAPPGGTTLDLSGGLAHLAAHGPEATGLLAWLVVPALALLLRRRHGWSLLALAGLAAPAVASALVPQGRDAIAPLANLAPLAAVVATLVGAGVGGLVARVPSGIGRAAATATGAAVLVGLALPRVGDGRQHRGGLETRATGRAVVAALRSAPPGPVQATFETAPVVHLAGRAWRPWPDPWLGPETPDVTLAVVSGLDPGWREALRDPDWSVRSIHGDDRDWAAVLVRTTP